jgi:amino acid transporter
VAVTDGPDGAARIPAEPARHLRRVLGLGQFTASGVGLIIGAGIYVLLAAATDKAGAGVWISFVVAGALSALTALGYAELAAMLPNAGAEYDYTRRVAPLWAAFVVGWIMLLGLMVAAAAVALGFADYLNYFVDVPVRIAALALIVVATAIASCGISESTRLTVALSVIQVGGLVAVVVIGVPHLGDHSLVGGASFGGVVSGAALVFFAFIGFDEVITLAEETRAPTRTVPRALSWRWGSPRSCTWPSRSRARACSGRRRWAHRDNPSPTSWRLRSGTRAPTSSRSLPSWPPRTRPCSR